MARRKLPWGWIGAGAALAVGALVATRDSVFGGCSEDDFRKKVVDAARSEVGKKNLDVYFRDAAPQFIGQKPSWCGIFALWSLHQAGLAKDVMWKTGIGFLRAQDITTDPKPGDIAYYDKFSHQAIVAAVHGDTVDLINGNGSGGVVSLSSPEKSKARAYYSIANYIKTAQKDC